MKPIKYSVSRKCFRQLSARQRRRIALEVKDARVRTRLSISQDFVTPEQSDNSAASCIHLADSFPIDKVSFTNDISNDISNISYNHNHYGYTIY